METWEVWSVRREDRFGDYYLVYVEKTDTGRSYGMKAIDICTGCDLVAPGSEVDINGNMAPIASALRSNTLSMHCSSSLQGVRGVLNLLSPRAIGGYLLIIYKENSGLMLTRLDSMLRNWFAHRNTCMTNISFLFL